MRAQSPVYVFLPSRLTVDYTIKVDRFYILRLCQGVEGKKKG